MIKIKNSSHKHAGKIIVIISNLPFGHHSTYIFKRNDYEKGEYNNITERSGAGIVTTITPV